MILRSRRWLLGGALLIGLCAGGARADDKGNALVKEVVAAGKAVKSLTAEVSFKETYQGKTMDMTGKVRLMKPNFAYVEMGTPFGQIMASDGKNFYTVMTAQNQYLPTQPASALGPALSFLAPVGMFFDPGIALTPATSKASGASPASSPIYAGKETVEGKEYDVLQVTQDQPQHTVTKFYVGADKLVLRTQMEMTVNKETITMIIALNNVKKDLPATASDFAYKLPKGAVVFKQPNYDEKLVAVGKDAPTFSIPTLKGTELTIYEATKTKKVLMLNFWFYG
jgi:outer membrane lipoprotein-sorting protein